MRRAEIPEPTICIQEFYTSWTKRSRGGSGAVARNNVPEALPLPEVAQVSDSPTVLKHLLVYKEQDNFFERARDSFEIGKSIPHRLQGICIAYANGELRVSWNQWGVGAPKRPAIPQPVLVLQRDQWGRVLFNGRQNWEGPWWYERWVYNIGLFTRPNRDVFVATEPAKIFSMMASLW